MSAVLTTIPVGELQISDVGERIVTTRDGVAVDGTLTQLAVYSYQIKEFVVVINLTIDPSEGVKIQLSNLPADFQVQAMRDVEVLPEYYPRIPVGPYGLTVPDERSTI